MRTFSLDVLPLLDKIFNSSGRIIVEQRFLTKNRIVWATREQPSNVIGYTLQLRNPILGEIFWNSHTVHFRQAKLRIVQSIREGA